MARSGQRTWVYLGAHRGSSPCAVWGMMVRGRRWDTWALQQTLRAYDMGCYLKLPSRLPPRLTEPPRDEVVGSRVSWLLTGDVVYALYSRESHAIKIGRTTDIRRRWVKLEHESGQLRQLVSVWQSPDSRSLERELHERWRSSRTFGEWFAADPVLDDLRGQLKTASAAKRAAQEN